MPFRLKYTYFLFFLLLAFNAGAQGKNMQSQICGKWECTDKSIRIEIYMKENIFRANIIWFKDTEGKPMDFWTDKHNPDPALRNRKILGMSVLSNLRYDAGKNSWEDGIVYDSKHGRDWNASANIDKNGFLRVRGYWHFKFIGRTMDFVRM